MIDNSSRPDREQDSLSAILRGLRLDGVDYARGLLRSPWALDFPEQEEAWFHFVARRNCWLSVRGGEWLELQPGAALLLPRGAAHVVASDPSVPPTPIGGLTSEQLCSGVHEVCVDGEGERSVLFFASMAFNVESMHPLLRMMPDLMRVDDLAAHQPDLPHLLEALGREVCMDRVGAGGMMARLADVLAASIIRSWVELGCGEATGWIAAVRNPDIGRVLAAIHRDPSHDWTIEALAKLMGASRSAFAERFAATVGVTPARYVAEIRMSQARQWLAREKMRIGEVAQRLGYESEASFSRAFKRITGQPPSALRHNAAER